MNRRVFLRGAATSGVVLGSGALYLGLRGAGALPEPTRALSVLDPVSFGVLVLFAERVLDSTGADPTETTYAIDQSLRYTPPESQRDLRLVLAVLENSLSGMLTRGKALLFSELTPDARDEALRRWGRSPLGPLRGASQALRKLCLSHHYAHLDAAKATGYPGPPFEKPEPPPIEARRPLAVAARLEKSGTPQP